MTIPPITVTRQDLQEIITESVDVGVRRAFTRLGIDHQDPIEMQHDFTYLRSSRQTVAAIKSHSLKVITTAVVGGLLAYLVIGFTVGENSGTAVQPKLSEAQLGMAIVELATRKYYNETKEPR